MDYWLFAFYNHFTALYKYCLLSGNMLSMLTLRRYNNMMEIRQVR